MEDFWYQDKYPVDRKLESLDYKWENKFVVDLGCNIGLVRNFVLDRGARGYVGVDLNEKYIKEAKKRNPRGKYVVGDVLEFLKEREVLGNEVVLALGLFHHLEDKKVEDIINLISGDLIFEVPTGESEYKDYRVRGSDWYGKMVSRKFGKCFSVDSGMPLDSSYPFERRIFLCSW
jgi:predicted TPR repeat methyltransferase